MAGERPARAHLEAASARLGAAGIDPARADAEWLLAGLLGVGRAALALRLDAPLPGAMAERFRTAVGRRAAREPVQQILGWEEFRGLRIAITPDVLVPRPETEVLGGWALEMLPPVGAAPVVVMDVGTGSGCLACAIAHERPDARVVAIDCARAALAVARANVEALGVAGRVRCVAGDLIDSAGPGVADLIVANLPYLPTPWLDTLPPEVRDHEPRAALDGGADGLALIGALVLDARRVLRPGGALVLETAGGALARATGQRLREAGYRSVELRADLTGVERFAGARWPGDPGREGAAGARAAARVGVGACPPSGARA
jgi:release factor glutamine methyltransferase